MFTDEQAEKEYIQEFLEKNGHPDSGTIHLVEHGNEANYKNEALDPVFHPDSAVVLLIPQNGGFMDGQCYDAQGYKVYAD